jgi:DNA-binding transcriptional regulator LsrR (DeoR family)
MHSMYTDGSTLEQVAARYGVSRQRVLQIFQESGLPTRSIAETHALKRERLFREFGEKAWVMFQQSEDIDAIASQLGITPTAARRIITRYESSRPGE